MSSPSEPDDIVSTSIERSFLPSFITEPLPNCRSIWDSAADRALLLSMEDPSTIRRAVADIVVLLMARIRERDKRCGAESALEANVHHLFLVRNMFFFGERVLSVFNPQCPKLNPGVS